MKKTLLITMLVLFNVLQSTAQSIEFYDGFENGLSNWSITGTWGTTTDSFIGAYAMTDSPTGNYSNNQNITATMINGVNLDTAVDAYVELTAKYFIEYAFDYIYIEASHDAGANWVSIGTFTGDSVWWRYNFSLAGFVGYDDVRCRIRFYTDQAMNFDGFYVDEFKIYSSNFDINPPMILHTPLPHYEGSLTTHDVAAEIADFSGVSSANLHYWVDNVPMGSIGGNNYSGNNWLFTIPAYAPGSWIDYYIIASDSSTLQNTDTTKLYQYIAGNYIKHDNGTVNFVEPIGNGSNVKFAAVKFSLNGVTDIVSALIRTYEDPFIFNADIEFHLWKNDSGVPGDDLVTPFMVAPAASYEHPHLITRIDLRPYADSLTSVIGDFFIGFTVPVTSTYVCNTSPSTGNQTYVYTNGAWILHNSDFHFRMVTSNIAGAPQSLFTYDNLADPIVEFTDVSVGTPAAWHWDFDDNNLVSSLQNPQHIFTDNGTYNVCLTVNNGISNNTSCQFITVQNCIVPVAGFDYLTTYSPEILFNDTTLGFPTSWQWDFGDGGTFGFLNPMHTYAYNDTFTVYLIAGNALGSDTICQDVIIYSYVAPEASFSYDPAGSPIFQFYDESSTLITNTATNWYWDFDDNGVISTLADPLHTFSQNGIYNVCLTASNQYGSDTYCNTTVVAEYEPPTANFTHNSIYSPSIQFLDQSTNLLYNAPDNWLWDFGDGNTSQSMNPTHVYAQNGNYLVCLIVYNTAGSDTICQSVVIDAYFIPEANFDFQVTDPIVEFTDLSIGLPDTWTWDFDDNGATSTLQYPSYTFSTNGTFNVCLIAANYLGADTFCSSVTISSYMPPVSSFSYSILLDSVVFFHDESINNPDSWLWDFGFQGDTSISQHPNYTYPETGTYTVCLTSSNAIGTSASFCQDVSISLVSVDESELATPIIYPNPFTDQLYISGHEQNSGIRIYNMVGQDVSDATSAIPSIAPFENTEQSISFNNLPAGIYLLKMYEKSKTHVYKVIKE